MLDLSLVPEDLRVAMPVSGGRSWFLHVDGSSASRESKRAAVETETDVLRLIAQLDRLSPSPDNGGRS
jgi:hypothetical protein